MQIDQIYSLFKTSTGLSTDTRQLKEGCIFLALKGPSFNGNKFAQEAILNGAAYAIIDEEEYQLDERTILVEDGLATLQELARHHRSQFDIPVIGLTGSNGKTTTKELISAVLGDHYSCLSTKGNLNNHIGVPLTLLQINEKHEVAVIEMGANHVGEIAQLCEIALPTHGLITNIGKAHLEGFGGIEGVKKGKSELYKFLSKHHRIAFVNQEEDFLTELSEIVERRVFYKSSEAPSKEHPEYEIQLLSSQPYIKVAFLNDSYHIEEIQTQLIGAYNFNNIMTAIALGKYFKVPSSKINEAISSYLPQNNRSQVLEYKGIKVILDAYNANPVSMKMALNNLKNVVGDRAAILGEMKELGEYSIKEHCDILEFARACDLKKLILVGEGFSSFELTTGEAFFSDTKALKSNLDLSAMRMSTLLVKGSRSVGLEKLFK